ncbi:diguanylate cyclase [Actinoplanes sp. SE50]|uniref:putative bifunctional diguanylate cyclase/phosphodiesterase n=1 Tax=unclassified Actinoplanes TaxID=2626549 RepID=UPI00023ECF58|nr:MULTISPECIES: EAL domain-containing protein [unclassified Actinoplanes]AEV87768.1 Signaling protein ykoW [Actinoplanes sp. SE50/110]ATO86170.1 diguanylate cyclase [Actinoplanes sp. SE50]SLM03584.1 putative diguanylate cyclase/phosphodiesterase with PAS sensor [Actinoplanes sp. SE50/110]
MTLNNGEGPVDIRRWVHVCIAVAAVLAVLAVLVGTEAGGRQLAADVSTWALAILPMVAAGTCVWRSRLFTGRARWGWAVLGAGVFSWGAGASYTVAEFFPHGGDPQIPSWADLGFTGLMLLVPLGLLILPSGAQPLANRARSVLDGLLVASSLVLVGWVFVVDPRLGHGTAGTDLYLTLSYPLGDIVMATIIGYMLPQRRALYRCSADLTFFGLGVIGFAISDIGYAYQRMIHDYQAGALIDMGWIAGFCLIIVGAARPKDAEPLKSEFSARAQATGVMFPYAAVTAALFASALFHLVSGHSSPFVTWTRSLLILLLIGRQVLTLLENRNLTRTLEARVDERTAELYAREQRFHALVRHSSDVVTVIDADGRVTFQSESMLRVFGYGPELFVGRRYTDLVDAEVAMRLAQAMRQVAVRPYATATLEVVHTHRDGRKCPSEVIITNLVDDPHVGGFVLNTRDISERKELQEQLVHEAYHDPLTQLANRVLFHDRAQAALARTTDLTVLHLDLDGFKRINDSLGHLAGDQLLVQIADRVQACVRAEDLVARFGADEFAVLIEAATGDEAEFVARRILDDLELPVEVGARRIHVRASIGLAAAALLEPNEPDGAEQLLRNADLAMHHAKAAGGSIFTSFHPRMREGLVERLELENDLRAALENHELRLHYQPTIDLETSAVVGFEALVRWPHPTRGMINPLDFIPIAEATGLIVPLGRWVLHEACRQAVEWSEAADGRPLKMSVNVSVRQFDQQDFAETVSAVLAETGMPADRLCLEMTESVLMTDTEANLEQLVRLKALGLTLAIDDFGTGYSSLAYLRRFPVDTLKIDRSFVERLGVLAGDTALTDTIVRLGKSLGMATVAEGIEEFGQLAALREMGCGFAQGYYFSRPVPAVEAGRLFLEGADAPL